MSLRQFGVFGPLDPVHATCHLRGKRIMTILGPRIVDRVEDGDAGPYPVVTTDGRQWKDEEVWPEDAAPERDALGLPEDTPNTQQTSRDALEGEGS